MTNSEILILVMGASMAVYSLCFAWILLRSFKNDKKYIKKII